MDHVEVKRRFRTAKAMKSKDQSFIASLEGADTSVTGDMLFKALYEAGLVDKANMKNPKKQAK